MRLKPAFFTAERSVVGRGAQGKEQAKQEVRWSSKCTAQVPFGLSGNKRPQALEPRVKPLVCFCSLRGGSAGSLLEQELTSPWRKRTSVASPASAAYEG